MKRKRKNNRKKHSSNQLLQIENVKDCFLVNKREKGLADWLNTHFCYLHSNKNHIHTYLIRFREELLHYVALTDHPH